MKRLLPSLALAALLVPLNGAFEPAEARGGWFGGVDFAVGGVHFALGFADFDRHRWGPGHFYRTEGPLRHRGYECGSACFIRKDVYYHHAECPLVLRHFHVHHFDPYPAWSALPWGGLYYYPHYRPIYRPRYQRPYRPWYGDYRTEPRRHYGHRHDREYRRDYDDDSDSDSDSDRRWRRGRRYEIDDRYDADRGRAARSRSRDRRYDD